MFLGRFHHNLDSKGRLTVPARFRDQVAEGGAYVMQGFDHNLMVLPVATFEALSQRINHKSITDADTRVLRRMLFSSADFVEVDKAGRILVPQFLRDAAGLESGVVVVGSGEYFELWSPEQWDLQLVELQDAQANADRFSELDLAFD